MGVFQRTERSMVREMCEVQVKGRNRAKDLIPIFGLNETIDHLFMASSGSWYGHV